MKKLASLAGPSITLVVALFVLFAGLTAFLLANSLRGQLEEAQGQLKETQSELQEMREAKDQQQKVSKGGAGPAAKQPGQPDAANKSRPQDNVKDRSQNKGVAPEGAPEGKNQQQRVMLVGIQGDGRASLPYVLLLALGLVVLASLTLVVTSALALRSGGWGSGKAGSGVSTPSATEISNLERANALEEPLEDRRWTKLVEECVEVVDELDEHLGGFDAPRREVAEHVILRLGEILERSGVEVISNAAIFDRARHKPDADHTDTGNGAAVRETLSPGFAVGPRVLRRARVRLE